MTDKEIEFPCQVTKIQMMQSDSAIRVTLDLPETATAIMGLLAECQRMGWILSCTITTHDADFDPGLIPPSVRSVGERR